MTLTYRLASTTLVSAPGTLAWAINGYKLKSDRQSLIEVMRSWPTDITDKEWDSILKGRIPYKVQGETVVLTLER